MHRLAYRVAGRWGRMGPGNSRHRRSRAAAGLICDELNYASDATPYRLAAIDPGQDSSAGQTRNLTPLSDPHNLALNNAIAAEPSYIGIDHPIDKS